MDDISPSDVKAILHSKQANLYYLEHCRVLVNGGRIEYGAEECKRQLYWNIPIANTATLLLGTGTSVTATHDLFAACSFCTWGSVMRATVTIDDELYEQALEMAEPGMDKSELFRVAVETFVRVQAAKRLAALGTAQPDMQEVPRQRSRPVGK